MLENNHLDNLALLTLKGLGKERWAREDRKVVDLSKTTNKDNLWCINCKKPRHTIEKC